MRRRIVALLTATLMLSFIASSRAGSAATVSPTPSNGTPTGPASSHHARPGDGSGLPDLDVIDPIRYALKDAIIQHVQVLSRNGNDRIWVDVIRPRTAPGVLVPVIMDMSPYYNTLGRGWVGDCKTPTTPSPLSPGCATSSAFPEFYDDYFVPRGYAVALMDLRGTRNTSGCQVYGDRAEVEDGVDVVDWLVDQPWSNGKVGLTGGSYDGTMASGVAVEQPLIGRHPDAVSAVAPIRAIDRWYDYHFYNGVPSAGHAATPGAFTEVYATADFQTQDPTSDPMVPAEIAERKACVASIGLLTDAGYAPSYQDAHSRFWNRRDYVQHAHATKSAFFLIHGLYDFNVKTMNVANMWAALPVSAPKKLWLEDADHVDPDTPKASIAKAQGEMLPFPFQQAYRVGVHRWWAQFLKGLSAGALLTPTVEVQQGDGTWLGSRTWPLPATDSVLRLGTAGRLGASADQGTVAYRDGASNAPATVRFLTRPATYAQRISGQCAFSLDYSLTGADTSFSVQIDDLPPAAKDDAPVTDPTLDQHPLGAFTVSYAFARAAYAGQLHARGISYPTAPAVIVPRTSNHIDFGSLPMDYLLKPGHRLRFTFGTGLGATVPSATGGTVSLSLGRSTIRMPIARSAH